MKDLPTFEDARNRDYYYGSAQTYESNADYKVDFSTTEPRKFKEDTGVRFYENGMVDIDPYVYRRPNVRRELRSRYGLEYLNPFEERGYTYFDPEWKPVKKDWIERDFYLYDPRHHMVVCSSAFFYGGYARLVGQKPVMVLEYNKKAREEFVEKHRDLFNFALVYGAMKDHQVSGYYAYWQLNDAADKFLTERRALDLETVRTNLAEYEPLLQWLHEQQVNKTLNSQIRNRFRIRHDYPFLYYKEG